MLPELSVASLVGGKGDTSRLRIPMYRAIDTSQLAKGPFVTIVLISELYFRAVTCSLGNIIIATGIVFVGYPLQNVDTNLHNSHTVTTPRNQQLAWRGCLCSWSE